MPELKEAAVCRHTFHFIVFSEGLIQARAVGLVVMLSQVAERWEGVLAFEAAAFAPPKIAPLLAEEHVKFG